MDKHFYKKFKKKNFLKIYKKQLPNKVFFFLKKKINKILFIIKYNNKSFQNIIDQIGIIEINENVKWLCPNKHLELNEKQKKILFNSYNNTKKSIESRSCICNYEERVFFDKINYEFDFREIWEYGRFHFLVNISQYYYISKNNKALKLANNAIKKFFSENRLGYGLNWIDGLQLSIRIYSLLYYYFNCKKNLDDSDQNYLIKLIFIHKYILEKQITPKHEIQNNHTIAEICGLIVTNIFIKSNINEIEINYKKLIETLDIITYDDGLIYEGSLPYKRFVLDFLNFTYILLVQNKYKKLNLSLLKNYINKISKILFYLSNQKMLIPNLGDSDFGRLFKINDENYYCINETLKISSKIINEKLFIDDKNNGLDFWFSGNFKFDFNYKKILKKPSIIYFKSNFIKYTNLILDIYFEFSPTGLGIDGFGGHGHNDMGNILINLKGEDLLLDLGNASYFSKKKYLRDYYRSSLVHNTISAINKDHSNFLGKYLIAPETKTIFLSYKKIKFNYIVVGKFTINNSNNTIVRRIFIKHNKHIELNFSDKFISKSHDKPVLNLNFPVFKNIKNNQINFNNFKLEFDKELKIIKKNSYKFVSNYKKVKISRIVVSEFLNDFKANWRIITN